MLVVLILTASEIYSRCNEVEIDPRYVFAYTIYEVRGEMIRDTQQITPLLVMITPNGRDER